LPSRVREELNKRLFDGQRGPQILPWLNSLPEVLAVLDERFGEEPVTHQNLSEWRNGGFKDWLGKREAIDRTKILAQYCTELASATGDASGLPAAIAGGQLMEILENFDVQAVKDLLASKPKTYIELLDKVARRQKSKADERIASQNERRLSQNQEKLAQTERALQLAERKFQRQTADLFLKWYADQKAKEIVDSKAGREVKMERLVHLMFGERPTPPAAREPDTEAPLDARDG
jgi:hypothetical protein